MDLEREKTTFEKELRFHSNLQKLLNLNRADAAEVREYTAENRKEIRFHDGNTLLHWAAYLGKNDIVNEVLRSQDGQLDALKENDDIMTPLDVMYYKHKNILDELSQVIAGTREQLSKNNPQQTNPSSSTDKSDPAHVTIDHFFRIAEAERKKAGARDLSITKQAVYKSAELQDLIQNEILRTKRKVEYCLKKCHQLSTSDNQGGLEEALIVLNFLEVTAGRDVYPSDSNERLLTKKEIDDVKEMKRYYVRGVFGLKSKEAKLVDYLRAKVFKSPRGANWPEYMQPKDFKQVVKDKGFVEIKNILGTGLRNLTHAEYLQGNSSRTFPLEEFRKFDDGFADRHTNREKIVSEFVDGYVKLRGHKSKESSDEKVEEKVRFHLVVNAHAMIDLSVLEETNRARNKNAHDFADPLVRDHSEVVFEVCKAEVAVDVDGCLEKNEGENLEDEIDGALEKTKKRIRCEKITLTGREVLTYFRDKRSNVEIDWRNPSQQEKLKEFTRVYLKHLALLSDVRNTEDVLQGLTIERKQQILRDLQEKGIAVKLTEAVPDHAFKVNIGEAQKRVHDFSEHVHSEKELQKQAFQIISSVMSIPDMKFLPLPISYVSLSSIFSHVVKTGKISETEIATILLPHEKLTSSQRRNVAEKLNALQFNSQTVKIQSGDKEVEIDIQSVVRNILCLFDQGTVEHELQFRDVTEAFRDRNFVLQLVKIAEKRLFSKYKINNKNEELPESNLWKDKKKTIRIPWELIDSWISRRVRLVKNQQFAAPYVALLLSEAHNVRSILREKGRPQPDVEKDLTSVLKTLVCIKDYNAFLHDIVKCAEYSIGKMLGKIVLNNKQAGIRNVLEALLVEQAGGHLEPFFKYLEECQTQARKYNGAIQNVLERVNDLVLDSIDAAALENAHSLLEVSKNLATQIASPNKPPPFSLQRALHEGKLRLHEGMRKETKGEQDAIHKYTSCLTVLGETVSGEMMALSMMSYAHARLGKFDEASSTQTNLWEKLCTHSSLSDLDFKSAMKESEASAAYHNLLRDSTEHKRFLNLPTVRSNLIFYKFCRARKCYTANYTAHQTRKDTFETSLQECIEGYDEVYKYLETQRRITAKNGEKRFVERQAMRVLARRFVIHAELARLAGTKDCYHFLKALELLKILHKRRESFFGSLTDKVKYTSLMIESAMCPCFSKEEHCNNCYKRHAGTKYKFYYTISPFDGYNGSCHVCARLFHLNGPYCRHLIPQRRVVVHGGEVVDVDIVSTGADSLFHALSPAGEDVTALRKWVADYIAGRLQSGDETEKAKWKNLLDRRGHTVPSDQDRSGALLKFLQETGGGEETLAAFPDWKKQPVIVFSEALSPRLFVPSECVAGEPLSLLCRREAQKDCYYSVAKFTPFGEKMEAVEESLSQTFAVFRGHVHVPTARESCLFSFLLSQCNDRDPSDSEVKKLRAEVVAHIKAGLAGIDGPGKEKWKQLLDKREDVESNDESRSTFLNALTQTGEGGEETLAAFADLRKRAVIVYMEAVRPRLLLPSDGADNVAPVAVVTNDVGHFNRVKELTLAVRSHILSYHHSR